MEQLDLFDTALLEGSDDQDVLLAAPEAPERAVSTTEIGDDLALEDKRSDPGSSEGSSSEASGWTLIHRYSRAQALADGTLIDVSETARELGVIWPVAVTADVWQLIEQIPGTYSHEDVPGRLWDVLWMLRCAIKPPRGYGRLIKRDNIVVKEDDVEIHYRVIIHHRETAATDGDIVLKAVSGPGDHGEPVMTIMRTYES